MFHELACSVQPLLGSSSFGSLELELACFRQTVSDVKNGNLRLHQLLKVLWLSKQNRLSVPAMVKEDLTANPLNLSV